MLRLLTVLTVYLTTPLTYTRLVTLDRALMLPVNQPLVRRPVTLTSDRLENQPDERGRCDHDSEVHAGGVSSSARRQRLPSVDCL